MKQKMSVKGVRLVRAYDGGWIIVGRGLHLTKSRSGWTATERTGSTYVLGTGRTLAEVIEDATTVWECDGCQMLAFGATDIRGQAHGCEHGGHWRLVETPMIYADTIKVGVRVSHEFLGSGTVTELLDEGRIFAMVRFDVAPDPRYNTGQNPAMVTTATLKRIPW